MLDVAMMDRESFRIVGIIEIQSLCLLSSNDGWQSIGMAVKHASLFVIVIMSVG
jgi:hypothetical protein